ncbi:hypothetical protein WI27_10215 [Burkholderia cepacia]|nr:hypothetical protein WI27_10215 [Burkholderia cepacia]
MPPHGEQRDAEDAHPDQSGSHRRRECAERDPPFADQHRNRETDQLAVEPVEHDPGRGEQQRAATIDTLPVREVVAVRTLTAFRRRHGILPQPAGKLLEELVALTREER